MKNKIVVSIIIILVLFLGLIFLSDYLYNKKPSIDKIVINKKYNKDNTKTIKVKAKRYNNKKMYCSYKLDDVKSEDILVENNICKFNVNKSGKYNITFKYDKKTVSYKKYINVDGIISISIKNKNKYIALGDNYKLEIDLPHIGNVDTKLVYESSNPEIASIDENGVINTLQEGEATITVTSSNGLKDSFDLRSTGLIRPMQVNNNKQIVPCHFYSEDDAKLLDEILDYRVKSAGEGTRAGVAAAAKFLALEYPYLVPYFYENGRENTNGIDGEGRYYHKGLYLSESDEKEIDPAFAGPAAWGCPLTNYEDDGNRKPFTKWPNGLDCSGFVTWALYNGGFDVGDVGAGLCDDCYDVTDNGVLRYDKYEFVSSGDAQPGDLIGWWGHIGIIAGIDEDNLYVVESLTNGVEAYAFSKNSPYDRLYSTYVYMVDMDDYYKE